MGEKIGVGNIEKGLGNKDNKEKIGGFRILSQIKGAKEDIGDVCRESKKGTEDLKSSIEKKQIINEIEQIGSNFGVDKELLIDGCSFLDKTCNQEQITRIINILKDSLSKNESIIKLQKFFEVKGFFGSLNFINTFEKRFDIVYDKKAENVKNQEEVVKDQEKNNSTLKTTLNIIKSNPITNNLFQETFSEFNLTEKELQTKDIKEQTKFFKQFLNKLYQTQLKETDPKKKAELKQSFSDLCENLKGVGIISDTDIANIIKLGEKESGIKNESILEINGFRKIDEKENIFYKDEGNTNNIITIDENGQLNEKIGSNSSSYEVNINSSGIIGEELDIVTTNLLKANFELKEIEGRIKHHFESQEKLEKIIEILDRDPSSLKEEESKIYEAYKDRKEDLKGIIKTINNLKTKIHDLEKRKIELETEARNQEKTTEEYGLEKNLAKNKVEILDTLGFTNTFSNENLDKLLEFLGRDEIKQILGFELDFSPERKKVTIEQLKKIFAKLLNSEDNQIYRNGTLNINYPYTETKHNLEVLMQDPKIIDGGILQFNGIKERLTKESNGNTY